MFSGIYCKANNANEINDSLLIDEYNKCIFQVSQSEMDTLDSNQITNSSNISSATTENSDSNKWECGMNVRAKYTEDGEYYEAVIEKIFENKYAVVRYLGYENEEVVKISSLKMSQGEKVIEEQLKTVAGDEEEREEEEEEEIYENDECDDSWKEIDWKVGMPCRAMYNENNTIYEATVQEVNKKSRTAVLMMTGFGKPFEAKFEDMYESIPEYRVKQERTAQKYAAERLHKENISDIPAVSASNLDTSISFNKIPKNEALVFERNSHFPSALPKINVNTRTECQGMMQPHTESDALACLISSNYLNGYYAGYYDCMRKFQNQTK
ncbi:hypothetical protein PGB90_006780 [Kerria lacca]